ncbi:sugar transferase [Listeria booriae]|uniref:Sugar transferase n=1 Tax=Listeria booriae TaxID=1552123 RepID=A0A841Y4S5_9LIST|nr:sugar transferase [Listeria booriae]MBC1371328.1 sugar transferase [Listeria booriae]
MIKPILDSVLALLLLILAIIPVVLSACIFYTLYRENPLYISQRAGKNGVAFRIYKLKSMISPSANTKTDAERMTRWGIFIRKTSLDELPQLWNVLKGDMSLVGPRPLLLEYNNLYTGKQRLRLGVKPGITGLAQVKGRNAISWERKFRYDCFYVSKQTLIFDAKIILWTIKKVYKQEGVSQQNHITMNKFTGYKTSRRKMI